MSLLAHIEELKKKHQGLSGQIEALEKDKAFDQTLVKGLKKQKLRLKDEINRLEDSVAEAVVPEQLAAE